MYAVKVRSSRLTGQQVDQGQLETAVSMRHIANYRSTLRVSSSTPIGVVVIVGVTAMERHGESGEGEEGEWENKMHNK